MVKIFISAGHSSTDPGAVKHVVERDEVWEIANYVAEELNKINGIKAYREAWEDGWRDTVNKSNNIGCDFFFEFHENAGGGDGAECIIHNTGNQWIADEIKKAFTEIGQQWRRTIVDPTYWVLKYTDCPAMIVECAFVDNWNDIKDWDEPHEKRAMAKSLAKHIAKIAGVDFKPTPSKPTPKPQDELYRVRKSWADSASQLGAFKNKDSAIKLASQNKGYKVFDSKGNCVWGEVKKKVVTEDGLWGIDTTKETQKQLKTYVDGIVSNQVSTQKKYCMNMVTSSWKFGAYNGYNSPMVVELQKLVGVEADGWIGYNTIIAMQKFLKNKGYYTGAIDGYAGYGTVSSWQKYLNR